MSKPDALMKRAPTDLSTRDSSSGGLSNEAKSRLKEQAATDLLGLLVTGGKIFLEAQQLRVHSDAAWEETQRTLAVLDAQTQSRLRVLEAELMPAQDKTERLRLVLTAHQTILLSDKPVDAAFSKALAVVLEQTDWT